MSVCILVMRTDMLYSPAFHDAGPLAGVARQPGVIRFPAPELAKPLYAASGYLAVYLETGELKPDERWLDNTILRNASIRGRDLLAWRASGGRYRCNQVEDCLRMLRDASRAKVARAAIDALDPAWALRLARILALQAVKADDRLNALTLFQAMYVKHGPGIIHSPHAHARVFQAVAYDVGDYALADEITKRVRCSKYDLPFMKADLLNPFTDSPFADFDAWLSAFNQNFEATGLEPIHLDLQAEVPEHFDRLRCVAADTVADGPLVTIVMSSWRPDAGIFTAVQSLLSQTWHSFELLVIDDASPDEFMQVLERVAAMDSRIRVIRQERNGGTYVARNTAMRQAKGEFMTFLDSDDWSHPRRIEKQVRELMADKQLMSTTSRALRTSPDLVFNLPGVIAQRENASSMMFRLRPVRERIGYFDRVRKGADTEFALRMRKTFGAASHKILEENLSLIRLTTGSLSREEFKLGWRHPSRASYRRSYEHWHRTCLADGTPLRMSAEPKTRMFPAPRRFLVEQAGEDMQRRSVLDIVFAADLRHGTAAVRALLDEARACARAGSTVGVLHLESFRNLHRVEMEFFWGPIEESITRGEVDEVLLTDAVSVGTLVVRDMTVLQFISPDRAALSATRLLLVPDETPRDAYGRMWYEPAECLRHAQEVFVARARCMTSNKRVRDQLRKYLPLRMVNDEPFPVVVDPDVWRAPGRIPRSVPVVGCLLNPIEDDAEQTIALVLTALQDPVSYEIRFLGGYPFDARRPGNKPWPSNVTTFDEQLVSRQTFIASCDFVIGHRMQEGSHAGYRTLLEAMASGAIVLVPERAMKIYGDAAICIADADIEEAIRKLTADRSAFNAQVERGKAFAFEAGRPERLVGALAGAISFV